MYLLLVQLVHCCHTILADLIQKQEDIHRNSNLPLILLLQAFGTEPMVTMPCPEGYSLLLATRVLFERCARATLLEQNENVQFWSSHKVEDLVYDEATRSVQGGLLRRISKT